jgi:hypothetical protein
MDVLWRGWTEEICMLGVPLGSTGASAEYVQRKLFARLDKTVESLIDFQDSQSDCTSYGSPLVQFGQTHFMRTTHLSQWMAQAQRFDEVVEGTAMSILGFPLSGAAGRQASVAPSLGGLGLRKVCDHAEAAFAASWREARVTAGEVWEEPEEVKGQVGSQREASGRIDQAIYEGLLAGAVSARERQRLRRVVEPHAGAFLTAVPSDEDGSECVMDPANFRVAVAYRLGVVVVGKGVSCPLCKQTVDELGDHAACCTRNGDVIVRHNRVRGLLGRFCEEGLLSPELEKRGILGASTGRRQGMSRPRGGEGGRGWQSTSLSRVSTVLATYGWRTLVSPTQPATSTQSTTKGSRAQLTCSGLWRGP